MLRKQFQLLFSPIGILAAMLLTGSMAYGVYKVALRINPGPLTAVHTHNEPLGGYAAHAEFEQECSHCHAPVHCITDNRCQECHIEIAEERSEAIGLHGLLPGTSQCQSCHKEHQGRDVNITTFAFHNVDHDALAGFSLVNHQTNYDGQALDCHSCHQMGDFGAESLDCTTCHANEDAAFIADHTAQYGGDCASCHDGHDRLANFDHNQIFPLEGQHGAAACEDCHVNQVYAGTPQECASCHEQPDIHDDSFGDDCIRCHTAAAWTPAVLRFHTFPLEHGSEGGQQACETCHTTTYTEYPCAVCHETAETKAAHAAVPSLEAYENCLACHPTGQIEVLNEIQVGNPGVTGAIMRLEP